MKVSMNMDPVKYLIITLLLLVGTAFKLAEPITIFMAGDSTMANKEVDAYPETGWGMEFHTFFNESVKIDNRARNGRSTKTFISENRWQGIMDDVKAGDYVFIQFGHNDEAKSKVERYTTPKQYKANLTRFVTETKGKEAIPVLLTPVTRRRFDENGNVRETHAEYSPLVKEVAEEHDVLFIDMDSLSRQVLQDFGVEKSKLLFLQLAPGEHPNYPEGVDDNTHFSQLGARKMAQLVYQEIKRQQWPLAIRFTEGKK